MDLKAGCGQVSDPTLLAVDQDNGMFDDQAGCAQGLCRLDRAAAAGDQILDEEDALSTVPDPFDLFPQPMFFGFLARINQGFV